MENPLGICGLTSQGVSNVAYWYFVVVSLNKLFNKQLNCWWFEKQWWSSCTWFVPSYFLFFTSQFYPYPSGLQGVIWHLLNPCCVIHPMLLTLEQCYDALSALLWCHNGHDGISYHQPYHCLLNHIFWRRSKKTSKLRVTGLCAGNSPVTGEFPAQMASNVENVSIWWRHHAREATFKNTYKDYTSICPAQQSPVYIFHGTNCIYSHHTEGGSLDVLPGCKFNSSPPGQNGRHFADDMFKCISLNENIWMSNKISLKYVSWGLIDNMTALIQIMAWRHPGDKPLSEPMLTQFTDTYMRH